MLDHFNELTPGEAELIALLMEECGEVVQICGKILRHGYESYHPEDVKKISNRFLLMKELGDVEAAIQLMHDAGDIADCTVKGRKKLKLESVVKYLHHNPKRPPRNAINPRHSGRGYMD